jgi:hydroxysqualene dehydroxylase
MAAGRVHIVGAGLAGLAAAVRLAVLGHRVVLYEAAPQAGGRCRSYFDGELGCRIDNGNHLLLGANRTALDYLDSIGAASTMVGPATPSFDFCDLASGERWTVAPGSGRLPWWILAARRRVPGSRPRDYLKILKLRRAGAEDTIADRLDPADPLFRRLWQPFAVAVLNTEIEAGSAQLLWHALAESFGAGGAALRPLVPRLGLSESFVDPALSLLAVQGAELRFGARLRGVSLADGKARQLDFDGGAVPLGERDSVILAVPSAVAGRLIPDLVVPDEFRGILNAHFRIEPPAEMPLVLGVVGGTAEWIFRKPGVVSVTVSAADRLLEKPADELAALVWRDVAAACRLAAGMPPWRIVKEKRATFAATPAQLRRRPGPHTGWGNLFLAGDWTETHLPATIEGAIRSGRSAAALAEACARND